MAHHVSHGMIKSSCIQNSSRNYGLQRHPQRLHFESKSCVYSWPSLCSLMQAAGASNLYT